ncbi:MAG: amidotransferase [Candidatus Omnitrophica bacterium]|nr:amidotransferase [Candidatus Omnitrophota bacterium]
MKKVLVFRHVSHEGLGTLETFLIRNQFEIEYLDLFRNSAFPKNSEPWDFVISMGGPMNADETDRYPFLRLERALIQDAIQRGKIVLGICLGAQMIARALGVPVYPGPQKEIGWYPIHLSKWASDDPAFESIENTNPIVFQWHGDTFDLPKGATLLASSEIFPNQAFRYKKSVYALQFHLEMTPNMIRDWVSKGKEELQTLGPSVSKERILRDIPRYEPSLRSFADQIYSGIFSQAEKVITA